MSKRKPAKIAPKRAKRPKAPKTHLVTDATPQPLSAPKTRVELVGREPMYWAIDERVLRKFGIQDAQPIAPQPLTRWSRLWAWLGRLGRP